MPTATHKTIIDALKTLAETVSGVPVVKVRSEAWLLEGEVLTTAPMLILTMGDERTGERVMGGAEFREYDVVATFLFASGFQLENGIADAKAWREAVQSRWEPDYTATPGAILAGVPVVWDVDAVDIPAQPEDQTAIGYNVARLGVTVQTNEVTHA